MTLPDLAGEDDRHPVVAWLMRCRWALAIALVAVLAMGTVVRNDFATWDDPHTIINQEFYNPPNWDSQTGILSVWNFKPIGALWIPVTYTIWGVVAELAYHPAARGVLPIPGARGALDPAWFHAASLLVHVVGSTTAFGLIRRLLLARGETRAWPAFFGAVIFAAHPLQVEPVAWTSGLKDVLWGTWAILAVYAYVRSAERGMLWRSRWWWAGLGFFVLSTLSKPTGMVTPGLALVAHRLAMGRGWRECARGLVPWLPWMLVTALWTKHFQPALIVPTLSLPYRPLIALDSVAFYLGKLFVPARLNFDYGRSPLVAREQGWLFWTWVLPVVAAALIWRNRRRCPLVLAGAAWALVATFPVLGLTRFLFQYFSTVADHYTYGAMVGVGLAAAWGLSRVPRRHVAPAVTAGVLATLALAGLSFRQMGFWRDSRTLYGRGIELNPRSYISETNIGGLDLYEANAGGGTPQMLRALARFDRAIALRPEYNLPHNDRAMALIFLNRRAEAKREIEEYVRRSEEMPFELRGDTAMPHEMLARYILKEREYSEANRGDAIAHVEKAIAELRRANVPVESKIKELEGLLAEVRARPTSGPATTRATSGPKAGD